MILQAPTLLCMRYNSHQL